MVNMIEIILQGIGLAIIGLFVLITIVFIAIKYLTWLIDKF
jgi:hypothetical protein